MVWTGSPKTWANGPPAITDADLNAEVRDRFNAVQRLLDRDVTVTTVVSSAAETTVYSYTVPGNTLSTDRRLRLSLIAEFTNSTGGNSTPTLRFKWGGSTRATFAPTLASNATARQWILEVDLNAENATNAQRMRAESMVTTAVADGTEGTKQAEAVARHHALAVDTTADAVIEISIQHDGATSTRSFSCFAVYLELMPY
jgi:hypothetical protein